MFMYLYCCSYSMCLLLFGFFTVLCVWEFVLVGMVLALALFLAVAAAPFLFAHIIICVVSVALVFNLALASSLAARLGVFSQCLGEVLVYYIYIYTIIYIYIYTNIYIYIHTHTHTHTPTHI